MRLSDSLGPVCCIFGEAPLPGVALRGVTSPKSVFASPWLGTTAPKRENEPKGRRQEQVARGHDSIVIAFPELATRLPSGSPSRVRKRLLSRDHRERSVILSKEASEDGA